MVSYFSLPISSVRQSAPPQAEQQVLFPTLAASQSSIDRPAIQMRLDSEGMPLKASGSIVRVSRTGSMPSGRRASCSFGMASAMAACVPPQRSHVSPSRVTSRCHRIFSVFTGRFLSIDQTQGMSVSEVLCFRMTAYLATRRRHDPNYLLRPLAEFVALRLVIDSRLNGSQDAFIAFPAAHQ